MPSTRWRGVTNMFGFPLPIVRVDSPNLSGVLGVKPSGEEVTVVFASAVTLTPSAVLFLPYGGEFTTNVNDIAVLKSIGNGIWHVTSYSHATAQSWQTVTGSRVVGNTYTNTTGRPIAVAIIASHNNTLAALNLRVGGITIQSVNNQNSGISQSMSMFGIVNPGITYSVTGQGLDSWHELR